MHYVESLCYVDLNGLDENMQEMQCVIKYSVLKSLSFIYHDKL